MLEITHARTGALEDLSPGVADARPAPHRARERRADAVRPRDAAASPADARARQAPARRSVTARAVRSDMLLVLLTALVAIAAGGALGCGHACNYGFSPCTAVSSASATPSPSVVDKAACPTEYRPLCLGKDSRCVTDQNGCQVCDCVESGSPVTTPHPRDVHDPREGR
ncbi:hypothetical protein [Sorangium sp. So ce1335]|uniref:hypothetical protein n=1 Tax=Sorangium sp. So ce1335 TaxID=3133335 RepID=UPI003F62357B